MYKCRVYLGHHSCHLMLIWQELFSVYRRLSLVSCIYTLFSTHEEFTQSSRRVPTCRYYTDKRLSLSLFYGVPSPLFVLPCYSPELPTSKHTQTEAQETERLNKGRPVGHCRPGLGYNCGLGVEPRPIKSNRLYKKSSGCESSMSAPHTNTHRRRV